MLTFSRAPDATHRGRRKKGPGGPVHRELAAEAGGDTRHCHRPSDAVRDEDAGRARRNLGTGNQRFVLGRGRHDEARRLQGMDLARGQGEQRQLCRAAEAKWQGLLQPGSYGPRGWVCH